MALGGWEGQRSMQEKKKNSKRTKRELRAKPRKLMLNGKLQKSG